MFKTAGRNQVVNATIVESLTDDFSPSDKVVCEFFINRTSLFHLVHDNLLFNLSRWVFLLDGDGETLKESVIKNLGRDELTIVGATTLGVSRGNHVEALCGVDRLASLLIEVRLAFENGLHTHHLVRTAVDFIKNKNCTTLHGGENRTFAVHHVAIDKGVAANQVILIGLDRDIDTHYLTLQLGAGLFDHRGLTVTRQTRDERGVEGFCLENLDKVLVEAERDVGCIDTGHQIVNGDFQLGLHQGLSDRLRHNFSNGLGHRWCGLGSHANHCGRQIVNATRNHIVLRQEPVQLLNTHRVGDGKNILFAENTTIGISGTKGSKQVFTGINHNKITFFTNKHHQSHYLL